MVISVIPAIYFSYILFTWHGLPFSGYTPKTVSGDPIAYITLLLVFWAAAGIPLGLISMLVGYIYGKIKNK